VIHRVKNAACRLGHGDEHAHLCLLCLDRPQQVANKLRADSAATLHGNEDAAETAFGVGGEPSHAVYALVSDLLLIGLRVDARYRPTLEVKGRFVEQCLCATKSLGMPWIS